MAPGVSGYTTPIASPGRRPAWLVEVSLLGLLGACGPRPPEADGVGTTSLASLTANSLTANSLTANSLTANSLTANSLTANSLTANSLTANALTAEALRDPRARLFLKYLYIVALLPDMCDTYDFADPQTGQHPAIYCGNLGLCARWRLRGIQDDLDCQEWVTAGLLAHVNALGIRVPFSARGPTPTLLVVSTLEADAYRFREGAFWGNLFAEPRALHAASDVRNVEQAKLSNRVCARSDADCGIRVIGAVDRASVGGDLARGWACEIAHSTATWAYALNDPDNVLLASASNVGALDVTFDEVAALCHPYLTSTADGPTAEQLAAQSPRVVTSYLTEAGLKMMYGCGPAMSPTPTGPCAPATGDGGCNHPGQACCTASDGTRFCADWERSPGRFVAQSCVNDQVAIGDEAVHTCVPRP